MLSSLLKVLKAAVAVLVVAASVIFSDPRRRFWAAFSADFLLGEMIPGLPEYMEEWCEFAMKEWADVPRDIHVPYTPFPEIQKGEYSMEKFRELSNEFTRPVIVRGLFDGAASQKWTPLSMATHFGKNRTFIALQKNNVGQGMKDGGKTWDPKPLSVPSVVENNENGGSNYIFNANFRYPEDVPMYDELEIAERMGLQLTGKHPSAVTGGVLAEPAVVQFFVGMQRGAESNPGPGQKKRVGGSTLHAAGTPNFNFQISGRKTWLMVAPEHAHMVKPIMLGGQFATLAKAGMDDWSPYQARWNNVPRFQGDLTPGDGILIPPWYYHEVINLPGQGTDECNCKVPGKCTGIDECADAWQLSIALRFVHTQASYRNNWLFSVLTDIGVRGKPMWPGFRFLGMHFFLPPWKDGPFGFNLNHTQSTAALDGGAFIKKAHQGGQATETTGSQYE